MPWQGQPIIGLRKVNRIKDCFCGVHPGDQLRGGLKNGTFYISGNATAQNIEMIVKTTAERREKDANRDTGMKMAGLSEGA